MLPPGTIINNRYALEANIGQGGAGTVYRALDQRQGATVALKHLSAAPGASATLAHEARLLARLSHPALPKVTDYFTEPAGQFLVMDYVPGQDLAHLPARPPVPVVLDWCGQLIAVLDYLHGCQPPLIHRDIKPENLKLGPANQLMLLDFGLAKGAAPQQGLTNLSVAGYTLQYAPLEQIQGQGTDYRSDYYALAATVYHLLTGTPPADALARAAAVIRRQPDPLIRPARLNPALSEELDRTLCAYLALDIDARPATLAPLGAAIAPPAAPGRAAAGSSAGKATIHIGAKATAPIPSPGAPPTPTQRARPQPTRSYAAAIWVLLVSVVAVLLLIPFKVLRNNGVPAADIGSIPTMVPTSTRRAPKPTRTPTMPPAPTATAGVISSLRISIDNAATVHPRLKIPVGVVRALASNGSSELAVAFDTTILLIQGTIGLEGHAAPVTALAWAGDERLLSGAADGTVGIWRPGETAAGRLVALGRGPVAAVAWDGDRRLLAAAGRDLVAVDLDTGSQSLLYTHPLTITALAVKADGSALALGAADGAVLLMDPAGAVIATLDAHDGPVTAVAWQPGAPGALATGSLDGSVRVWLAQSAGALLLHDFSTASQVLSLAWSLHDDGQFLLAGTSAHVQMWYQPYLQGVTTVVGPFGAQIAEHNAAVGSAAAVAWLSDGVNIATVDSNGLLWIWEH